MRIVQKLTDLKFLNVNKVVDEDNNVGGYLFAERLGVDSVAFICYDENLDLFLVNKEYKPPIADFVVGAFGGSIDKAKTREQIVVDEVKEEAGFVVSEDDVYYVGRSFVSTQMNQYCYLFLVRVNKDNQDEREPENAIEAMAETQWLAEEEVIGLDDWKAIAIVSKAKKRKLI